MPPVSPWSGCRRGLTGDQLWRWYNRRRFSGGVAKGASNSGAAHLALDGPRFWESCKRSSGRWHASTSRGVSGASPTNCSSSWACGSRRVPCTSIYPRICTLARANARRPSAGVRLSAITRGTSSLVLWPPISPEICRPSLHGCDGYASGGEDQSSRARCGEPHCMTPRALPGRVLPRRDWLCGRQSPWRRSGWTNGVRPIAGHHAPMILVSPLEPHWSIGSTCVLLVLLCIGGTGPPPTRRAPGR
jgi:hypothetical protein